MVVTSTYVAKTKRALQRFIICEKCGCEFTFIAAATGVGQNPNAQDAMNTAITDAHNSIGMAAAPCPDCGWYQKSMMKGLRQSHHGWLRRSGLALVVFAGSLTLALLFGFDSSAKRKSDSESIDEVSVYVGLGVGILLLATHGVLAYRYHPNAKWPQRPQPRRREPRAVRTLEYQQRLDALPPQVWYVFRNHRKTGPFSRERLIADFQAGNVLLTDHLWTEGMDGWRVASKGLGVPPE